MQVRQLLLALTLLTLVVAPVTAQQSEQQLLDAYLNEDMSVWKAYIDASDMQQLPADEQLRLLRYEYGFAAAMLSIDKANAKTYIQRFGEHIEQAKSILSEALYNVYMSAYHTYSMRLTMNVFAHGKAIYKCADAAKEADPNEPMVWVAQGNIHFYTPKMMGGDKRKALDEYNKADSLFMLQEDCNTRWELHAERRNREKCKEYLQK